MQHRDQPCAGIIASPLFFCVKIEPNAIADKLDDVVARLVSQSSHIMQTHGTTHTTCATGVKRISCTAHTTQTSWHISYGILVMAY